MDFLEELIDKAKVTLDIAYKATDEAVNTGKQKFNIASLENKRNKDYKKLGELYYESLNGNSVSDDEINEIVASITEKNTQISEIKEELRRAKANRVCASCGAAIEENTIFCPNCGTKLEYTTEE